jgi:hypothetical protein
MDMMLGQLEGARLQVVDMAFDKVDNIGMGSVSYQKVREQFDAKRHPDVCNGRKTEDEAITDFLEVYEIHHNTYNNFEKQPKVTRSEFREFYRTLSPTYEDDLVFNAMVRGVWGVKEVRPDVTERNFAGGIPDA